VNSDVIPSRYPSKAVIQPVILMVASHDQLMHQNSEWFVRQPRDIAIAPIHPCQHGGALTHSPGGVVAGDAPAGDGAQVTGPLRASSEAAPDAGVRPRHGRRDHPRAGGAVLRPSARRQPGLRDGQEGAHHVVVDPQHSGQPREHRVPGHGFRRRGAPTFDEGLAAALAVVCTIRSRLCGAWRDASSFLQSR
jgi:hypothetical protein